MHFKISKKVFYESLSKVSRAISSNSPIPALSGVKLEVYQDKIILTASNSDLSIQDTIFVNDDNSIAVLKEGSVVIEGRYLLDIVRKIDSKIVEIEIMDGFLTRFSGESTQFNINGMDAFDYPVIDFSKPEDQIVFTAAELESLINQTSFATSDRENKPILTGVNIHKDGNELVFVATDSYRLARKSISKDLTTDVNITVPGTSLMEVSKIIDRSMDIEMTMSDKKVQFNVGNTILQNRLIDGVYPETKRLIPTDYQTIIELDSRDLMNAIDRASFIKNDGISIVNFKISENEFIVSSKSQEVGFSKEEMTNYTFNGSKIDISFSGAYVSQALRALQGSKIRVSFAGEMKPFVIEDIENPNITHLILPVRTFD